MVGNKRIDRLHLRSFGQKKNIRRALWLLLALVVAVSCVQLFSRPLVSDADRELLEQTDTLSRFYMPIRQISTLPGFHWYGLNGERQSDPSGRYLLGVKLSFDFREATPNEEIEVGMYDLKNNCQWIKLGTSRYWNRENGCNLRFRDDRSEIIAWTDLANEKCITIDYDIKHDQQIVSSESTSVSDTLSPILANTYRAVTYPANPDWIICTDRPDDSTGRQRLYLKQSKLSLIRPIADLYIPLEYRGKWSCNIYPRFLPDGNHMVIDAPNNNGRQIYIIKIEL